MRLRIAAIAMLASIGGCTTIAVTDRDAETSALAKQLGTSASSIRLVSRCQFAVVPKGVTSGAFAAGVCMFANGALHIRVIDATTGKSEPYGSFGRSDIESVSLYLGILNQVQVRLPQHVLAMIMRPDGGIGFNESATRQMFDLLEAAGNKVVSSSRGIDIGGGSGGTTYIPLIIPKR